MRGRPRPAGQTSLPGIPVEPERNEVKLGYEFGEVASALQKEIRNSDEQAAVFWALLLADAAPYYAWKRVLITAAEDIGFGSPETVTLVCGLASAWWHCKEKSRFVSAHHLVMAVMALCRAPKNTEAEDLLSLTEERIKRGIKREMQEYSIDGHTAAGKARKAGWDEWYRDRRDQFGMPVNQYTEALWALVPEWDPGPPAS